MDSGQRPLYSKYETSNTNANPYGSGDPYYNASTGYLPPQKPKKGISKWIKFGVPALILVIVAVVVGAVVGTRNNNNNSKSGGSGSSNGDPAAAESSLVDQKNLGRFPTATDSEYFVPLYPSTVCSFFLSPPHELSAELAPLASDQYRCIHNPYLRRFKRRQSRLAR
jgi:hypothetical protein